MKQPIHTDEAPAALGPYSQAIVAQGLVFTAGQIGLEPASGTLVGDGIAAQTERALMNLGAVLEASGASLASVLKTTCYLADMADFAAFNEVYARFFPEPYPARATLAVKTLPASALVEVEAVAAVA